MKTLIKIFLAMVAVGLTWPTTGAEPQKTPAAKPVPARSVFALPSNVSEGRDPFFPESARPFEAVLAASKTVEISALSIKGFSGTPGHRLVIINNHTFGIGDEGDVLTPTGRVHLRCTQIGADLVTIEVNGQRRELRLGAQ